MAPKIQHIRSTVPHKRPDAALLVDGQMAQNQAVESPGAFIKLADGTLSKVGPTHVGPTAPNSTPAGTAGNSVGETWLNTSLTKPVLNVWNGVEWVKASSSGSGCWVGDAPPTEYEQGSLWWNSSNGTLYVWYDDGDTQQWVEASPGAPLPEQTVVVQESSLNLYVATTGSDTTGDGTQALPWATPHKAMAYLSHLILATDVTATINVADGTYQFSKTLNLAHPQGTQIFINGTSTTGTRPSGLGLNGGGVRGNTAATRSFNEAKLDAYYNTKWVFTGCDGLLGSGASGVTVDKVLIKNDGVGKYYGVLIGRVSFNPDGTRKEEGSSGGSVVLGASVAIHGFEQGGCAVLGSGALAMQYVTVTNCGGTGAVAARTGGSISFRYGTISNSTLHGLYAAECANIAATSSWSIGNGGHGISLAYGAISNCLSATLTNNATHGASVTTASTFNGQQATITDNGTWGVSGAQNPTIRLNTATIRNNSSGGVSLNLGGSVEASGATIQDNGTKCIEILGDGVARVAASTVYNGTLSPALNTQGNGDAYITST